MRATEDNSPYMYGKEEYNNDGNVLLRFSFSRNCYAEHS
jgi:hypothetical protein